MSHIFLFCWFYITYYAIELWFIIQHYSLEWSLKSFHDQWNIKQYYLIRLIKKQQQNANPKWKQKFNQDLAFDRKFNYESKVQTHNQFRNEENEFQIQKDELVNHGSFFQIRWFYTNN